MDNREWQSLGRLFEAASRLNGQEREALLVHNASEAPELVEQVRRMLAAEARAGAGLLPPEWPSKVVHGSEAISDFSEDPLIGADLGGFVVRQYLSHGGMGRVWLAQQRSPDREVAIKTLVTRGPEFARRLAFEARLLARLDHPNIARVLAAGERSPDLAWIAMDLVDGAERIDRYAEAHRLSLSARLGMLIGAARALAHAHQRGVLHRDVKPSNLLVDSSGRLRVIDFGVAAAESENAGPADGLEGSGSDLVGTLGYMAPEVIDGGIGQADARSDVYGLGVVAYQLLNGGMPIPIEGLAVWEALRRLREAPIEPPVSAERSLGPEARWVLECALASDPSRRYASMGAFARDLEALASGQLVSIAPKHWAYRAKHFARHRPWLFSSLLAAGLSLVAGTSALAVGYSRALEAVQRERDAGRAERDALERAAYSAQAALESLRQAQALADVRRSVGDFFVGMFGSLSPYVHGTEVRVRDLLLASYQRLEALARTDSNAQPLVAYAHGLGFQGIGDQDHATEAFSLAEQLWDLDGEGLQESLWRNLLPIRFAELAGSRGDRARAESYFDLGLEQLALAGMTGARVDAHAARARLRLSVGDWTGAREDLEAALALDAALAKDSLSGSLGSSSRRVLLELSRSTLEHRLGASLPQEFFEQVERLVAELASNDDPGPGVGGPFSDICREIALAYEADGQLDQALVWAGRELDLRLAVEDPRSLPVASAAARCVELAQGRGADQRREMSLSALGRALEALETDWPAEVYEALFKALGAAPDQERNLLVNRIGMPLLPIWTARLTIGNPAVLELGMRLGDNLIEQSQWAAAEQILDGLGPGLEGPGRLPQRALVSLRRAFCLVRLNVPRLAADLFDSYSSPWPVALGAPGSLEQLQYQYEHARALFGTDQDQRAQLLCERGIVAARDALASDEGRVPIRRLQALIEDFKQLQTRIQQKVK